MPVWLELIRSRGKMNAMAHDRLFEDAFKRKERQKTKLKSKQEKDELLSKIMSDRRIMNNLGRVSMS